MTIRKAKEDQENTKYGFSGVRVFANLIADKLNTILIIGAIVSTITFTHVLSTFIESNRQIQIRFNDLKQNLKEEVNELKDENKVTQIYLTKLQAKLGD